MRKRKGFWYEPADEHGLVPLLSRHDKPEVLVQNGEFRIIGVWHFGEKPSSQPTARQQPVDPLEFVQRRGEDQAGPEDVQPDQQGG